MINKIKVDVLKYKLSWLIKKQNCNFEVFPSIELKWQVATFFKLSYLGKPSNAFRLRKEKKKRKENKVPQEWSCVKAILEGKIRYITEQRWNQLLHTLSLTYIELWKLPQRVPNVIMTGEMSFVSSAGRGTVCIFKGDPSPTRTCICNVPMEI